MLSRINFSVLILPVICLKKNSVFFEHLVRTMVVIIILLVFLCASGISGGKFIINFPTVNCKPPIGEDCVEIRKCPYFNDLLNSSPIPRPKDVIDIIRAHQCDFQNNRPYVCCHKTTSSLPPVIETTTKIEKKPVSESDTSLDPSKIHRNFHLLPRDICGQKLTVGHRITNGEETELNEFPWMALIAYDIDDGGQGVSFKCAGTLISERFVLTAAHCILHEKMIGVRLGEYDLNRTTDCQPHTGYCAPPTQDFFIESSIIHPHYDQRRVLNDIALIKLSGIANFAYENVQPICLPMEDLDLSGKHADVIGWGVTEEGMRSLLLRKVSVPVVKLSVCQKTYQKFAPVTDMQICAGGSDGKDSCGGDSGGPLKYDGVIDGTTRFVQYGIVSYGPKQCGTDGKPGIYTKVFSFVNWILDQLDA